MRYYWLLIVPLIFCACNRHKTKHKITIVNNHFHASKLDLSTSYKLIDNFEVSDTGHFDIGIGDGTYAIIKRGSKLIDTIYLAYGIKKINDHKYFYYTIKGSGPLPKESNYYRTPKAIFADLGNFVIIDDIKKTLFNTLAPDVDDYFSSPSVINGKIYYWQIKKLDTTGKIKVSAAEFDPETTKTVCYFIMDDYLETDDNGYFPEPYIKNNTIYFDAGKDKLMKYSKDFKSYN